MIRWLRQLFCWHLEVETWSNEGEPEKSICLRCGKKWGTWQR